MTTLERMPQTDTIHGFWEEDWEVDGHKIHLDITVELPVYEATIDGTRRSTNNLAVWLFAKLLNLENCQILNDWVNEIENEPYELINLAKEEGLQEGEAIIVERTLTIDDLEFCHAEYLEPEYLEAQGILTNLEACDPIN